MTDHYYADAVGRGFTAIIAAIKSNTNAVAFAVNQGVIMLMLFEVIHWTEPQMFGFLSFVNAVFVVVVGKTTIATAKVDQRVEEQVAHREMTGTTGTGVFPKTQP